MSYFANPSAIVSMASGLAIVVVGLTALAGAMGRRPGRHQRRTALAFGGFMVAWGAQVVIANASNLARDASTMTPWVHANAVALILLYVPAGAFLLLYPRPRAAAGHAATWVLLLLPAVLLLLLYAQRPDLMVRDATVTAGTLHANFGPLFAPVGFFSVLGVFTVALAVQARELFATRNDAVRRQAALMTAALLSYVSYKAAELLPYAFSTWRSIFDQTTTTDIVAVWLAVLPAAGVVVGVLGMVGRASDTPWRSLLLLAGILPATVAIGETLLLEAGVASIKTGGVWRLGAAALMGYTLVRFRLFDLELHLWRSLPYAAYAALCGLGLAFVWGWQGPVLAQAPSLGAAASLGVVASLLPIVRVSRRRVEHALQRPERREAHDIRRLEVYGAAMAALGSAADSDPWLRRLRRQLRVTPAEHGLVAALAASPRLLNSQRPRPLEAGDIVGGRYRSVARISEGGHCIVHRAVDTQSGATVVLKELRAQQRHDAGMRIRLAREIAALEGLDDANVVRLLDVVDEGGCPILVLEYLTGGTLTRLVANGPLDAGHVAQLGCDILAGVQCLHGRGIVHRDIKPANILLNASGRAKVADLGIARLADEQSAGLTQMGQQPGTLAYMSPEQARGDRVDGRSDLYSVGVVLYELMAGAPALSLRGTSDAQIRRQIQSQRPVFPVPRAPPVLDAVLRRALAFEPEARYPDAEAFRAALLPLLGQPQHGGPTHTQDPEPAVPPTEIT